MRIVAGRYRGRRLQSLRGRDVRPTTDRVREALFSILADRVAGARVLDLFAGTGALGLEALSRGAVRTVFVDRSGSAVRTIEANIRTCKAETLSEVRREPAERAVRRLAERGERFDLIFLDPPYGKGMAAEALGWIGAVAAVGVLVVTEHASGEPRPAAEGWMPVDSRRYGDTTITFLERGRTE